MPSFLRANKKFLQSHISKVLREDVSLEYFSCSLIYWLKIKNIFKKYFFKSIILYYFKVVDYLNMMILSTQLQHLHHFFLLVLLSSLN